MTDFKNTRRALFSSLTALLICFTMLLGTTFAWFTDSVTSGGNVIQTGNLNAKLLMYNGSEYVDISESEKPIFGEDSLIAEWEDVDLLWEPGKTQIVYLGVENAGSLSLKYNIVVDVEDKGLVGALDYAIIDGATNASASALNVSSWTDILSIDNAATDVIKAGRTVAAEHGALEPDSCDYFALAVHMREDAGNEYKDKGIVVDITVMATQLSKESDSFGDDYDEGLVPTTTYMFSGADIHRSTTSSGNFELSSDIITSTGGNDSRYGYGYEYIIRKGADYTLNLNGKTVTHDTVNQNDKNNALTYLFVANHAGTKLTIEGEGKVYSHNSAGYACAIQGKDGTLVTVNGGDYEVDNGIAVWSGAGAHIVINGGSFVNQNGTTDHELIYSSGGVIDIYGGFFHNKDGNYTLNVEDRNRSTGFINVYGGTYVNFDPSTGGQDPNNIKVADGHMVKKETQENGDVWYTVVPIPEEYEKAATADDVAKAIESGKDVVLTDDVVITETLNVTTPTNIELNGKTLTVSRMEANSTLTVNGGTLVNGEATYPAISVNDGGKLVLNDVKVVGGTPCNVITSGSAQAAEIVGVQVFGGECVLNNCEIELNVTELRFSNSVFAIGIHGGSLTMNGGSITVKSVGSTREQYDYQSAIFAGGDTEKTLILNDVTVQAENFLYAWGGHTVVKTNAPEGTYTGYDVRNGGTYQVVYGYEN